MALEASDSLIYIIWVNWRCTYFKTYLQTQCLCLTSWEHQKKSDLHKSGSSLGAMSKQLKVPRSSVQTMVRKYKHHGTTQPFRKETRSAYFGEKSGNNLYEKGVKFYIDMTWKAAQQGRIHCCKTAIKIQTTVCNCTWGQRSYVLEKCPLVWWNKNRTVWP